MLNPLGVGIVAISVALLEFIAANTLDNAGFPPLTPLAVSVTLPPQVIVGDEGEMDIIGAG